MYGLNGVEIYLKIVLEVTADGRKQAKCIRIPEPNADFEFSGIVGLGVHQWGEQLNGWRPAINHRPGLNARLYWQPGIFGPKTRRHIERFIAHKYFEGLVNSDAILREAISSQLAGAGWYFGNITLK